MLRKTIDPFDLLHRQARKSIREVASQISSKKRELRGLEAELEKLNRFAGFRRSNVTARPVRVAKGRIDWSEVLEKLPQEFRSADFRRIRGLKDKRSSELFAAITRWINSGSVEKRERGVYVRVNWKGVRKSRAERRGSGSLR